MGDGRSRSLERGCENVSSKSIGLEVADIDAMDWVLCKARFYSYCD
jgi:hypothetical protein